jgi:hypothetical protein
MAVLLNLQGKCQPLRAKPGLAHFRWKTLQFVVEQFRFVLKEASIRCGETQPYTESEQDPVLRRRVIDQREE